MTNIKECRGCFENVDERASICPHCGTLQNRYKAVSIYVAAIAGVLSLIASSSTYLYKQIIEAINNQDPIDVLSYSHEYGGVFLNKSGNPVYVRSILLLGNDSKNLYSENIQTLVGGKDIKKYKKPRELFVLSPNLKDSNKHWREVWSHSSDCFGLLMLTDKAYLDKGLTKIIKGTLTYVSSSNGVVREKQFSAKGALLLKNKPECNKYGHPDTIFR